MNISKEVYTYLKTKAEADKAKALLSLELLGNNAVGIGDHSTGDFYKNVDTRGYMGGGMVGIRKPSSIPPESGPMSQGLRSLYNNGKKL